MVKHELHNLDDFSGDHTGSGWLIVNRMKCADTVSSLHSALLFNFKFHSMTCTASGVKINAGNSSQNGKSD